MKTILIADDDAVMARLIKFNLVKSGFDVAVCQEGLSVREKAHALKPVLAIFDLMLPGRSGLSLIEDFKKDPELKDIPLVVVTGQGKGSVKDTLLNAGADLVFTKPFSPTNLTKGVRDLIEARESEETPSE